MSTAALRNEDLRPPPPRGMRAGLLLALLVHGLLLLALSLNMDWRIHSDEVVSAELWAATPQVAAPRAAEPPPPPPAPAPRPAPKPEPKPEPAPEPARADAQIALEKAEREKKEKEREQAQAEKLQKQREAKAQAAAASAAAREQERAEQAEQVRQAKLREDNIRRMMGQADTVTSTLKGSDAANAAPSASYGGKLIAHVRPHILLTERITGYPAAEVEVRAAASGTILSRKLLKSSGQREWDEAVLRAIDRAGTLPRDVDGRVPPVVIISFTP